MIWQRYILLFIMFLLGKHICFPSSTRYLELADSADYFISRENWDKAEEKIIQALRLEPANFTNSLLLANLGLIQTQKGEYSKAVETLSLGLNIAPKSTVLLNNRAHAYLLTDSINSAINDIDKSLSIDSVQEWTLQTRAYLYLQDNELEKSKLLFDKLSKEFPKNSSVYTGYASIARIEGDNNVAIKNYKEAIRLNAKDNEAREALIMLLIETNDYSGARSELREALEEDPENAMFYLLRGYLHRLNYRLDEAQADKKIAISKGLDPKFAVEFIP